METLRTLLDDRIQPQGLIDGATTTWYFLVVRLPVASRPIRMKLLRRGIDAGIEDEIADDTARALGFDDCPVVAEVSRTAMVLPLWDGISERTLRRVARRLNDAVATSLP